MPAWLRPEDEPIWERAKDQVARQRGRKATKYGWALLKEDWPLVTYVFKQMGGKPKKKNPSRKQQDGMLVDVEINGEYFEGWLSWK